VTTLSFAVRSLQRACTAQAHVESPLGDVLLARTSAGLAGVWFIGQKDHPGTLSASERRDDPLLAATSAQLAEYFAGRRNIFDLALDLQGTPFQCAVWRALLSIDAGSTRSYADIAMQIGAPTAARAVGAAVGKNPLSVIVPCHRVLGGSGGLTGYAGGLDRKRALLSLEGVLPLAIIEAAWA